MNKLSSRDDANIVQLKPKQTEIWVCSVCRLILIPASHLFVPLLSLDLTVPTNVISQAFTFLKSESSMCFLTQCLSKNLSSVWGEPLISFRPLTSMSPFQVQAFLLMPLTHAARCDPIRTHIWKQSLCVTKIQKSTKPPHSPRLVNVPIPEKVHKILLAMNSWVFVKKPNSQVLSINTYFDTFVSQNIFHNPCFFSKSCVIQQWDGNMLF